LRLMDWERSLIILYLKMDNSPIERRTPERNIREEVCGFTHYTLIPSFSREGTVFDFIK